MLFPLPYTLFLCLMCQPIATILRLKEEDLSQKFSAYDITNPIQVDQRGNFLSYDLSMASGRNKRNAVLENSSASNSEMQNETYDTLCLNLTAFGMKYNIILQRKRNLIATNAQIFDYSKNDVTRVDDIDRDAVYSGYVAGSFSSTVAMTTYQGLAGYIKAEEGIFFIQPIEDGNDKEGNTRPQRHVVYKAFGLTHGLQGSKKSSSKSKRHAKRKAYNIEVLLTADDTVVTFHGRDRVQSYLITLLNIVDEIYQDDSIGHSINIVIVRLSLLSRNHSEHLIAHEDPATSLKNVCRWAYDTHHTDNHRSSATSYDHAIFLTRRRFGPTGMEGYAHVTGMCHPLRSCTLNHEDGFSSAFVVAHETGHVLGMEHDGEGNKCGDETSMGSIMAPLVQAAFHRYHWSRCSQFELKGHIRKFDCLLNNHPVPEWGFSPEYPGVYYSLDDQCRFDFGPGYKQCKAFQNIDICRTLWCSHDDNPMFCKTKNGPPVDGTECAENMWCFKSHCVWKNKLHGKVDGAWSEWSHYGICSRSCGTGVMSRIRECNSPRPSYNGKSCPGSAKEYNLCNTHPCVGSYDYRAEQCRYHQKKEYANRRHTWLPYESKHVDLKCELFCSSKETGTILSMGSPVADGTLCSYRDRHSVCINAECVKVGCDGVIGSLKRDDECGVCEGDGSQCRWINSTYKKLVRKPQNSYMKMFTIPTQARQVLIRETSNVPSPFIALKNRRTGRYVLNQKGTIAEGDVQRQVIDAGTMWTYSKIKEKEELHSVGPLSSAYSVMVVSKTRAKKLKVYYSYALHSRDVQRAIYQFEIRKWYPCSTTCGAGTRLARFGCRNKSTKKWVRKSYCGTNFLKRRRKPCSVECLPKFRWFGERWGPCSKSCGGLGRKMRKVVCQSQDSIRNWKTVEDAACSDTSLKLTTTKSCSRASCPPGWKIGNWSMCSVSCGKGLRRRQITCGLGDITVSDNQCQGTKPVVAEFCQKDRCLESVCQRDQSIFCKISSMAKYCSIAGYHQLCCDSCRSRTRE